MKTYWVYILASKKYGVLYIGITSDLIKRIHEHKHNVVPSFTSRFNVHHLVYFEAFGDVDLAIQREKQLKKWNRGWKIRLIEETNPAWNDLYSTIT